MRRERRYQRLRTLRGTELPRLLSLLALLAVIVMLMYVARDPRTWAWLGSDSGASPARNALALAPPSPAAPLPQAEDTRLATPAPLGPTDLDSDEADFMREALEAVTDLTLENSKEEMVAYERMVRWSLNQPFDLMDRRAQRDVLFTQLVNAPDDYRGKLLAVDLDVKRVLRWELKVYEGRQAAGKGALPDHVLPVYEAWGITRDSKAWPYLVVMVDLPPDMPLGDGIDERVRFAGYFFKVQKYYDGLHRASRAPVLIGRADWHPRPAPGPALETSDWYWTYGLVGGVVLLVGISLLTAMRRRRGRRARAVSRGPALSGDMPIDQWIQKAQGGQIEQACDSGEERPAIPDDLDSHARDEAS